MLNSWYRHLLIFCICQRISSTCKKWVSVITDTTSEAGLKCGFTGTVTDMTEVSFPLMPPYGANWKHLLPCTCWYKPDTFVSSGPLWIKYHGSSCPAGSVDACKHCVTCTTSSGKKNKEKTAILMSILCQYSLVGSRKHFPVLTPIHSYVLEAEILAKSLFPPSKPLFLSIHWFLNGGII